MSLKLSPIEIDYHAEVVVTGLSNLLSNPKLRSYVQRNGWDFNISLTNSPSDPQPSSLRIEVTAPQPWSTLARSSMQNIWVSLFMDHLDNTFFGQREDTLSEFSPQWRHDPGRISFGCTVPWSNLWDKNLQNRREDGIRIRLDITARPAPAQRITDSVLLRAVSRHLAGDLPDVQFTFPRSSRGTQSPEYLHLYAHSFLLAERSDYFKQLFNAISSHSGVFDLSLAGDEDIYNPELDSDSEHSGGGLVKLEGKNYYTREDITVIMVRDVAFVTWQAMLFYLHTSRVRFSRLSCRKGERDPRTPDHIANGWPPTPSPKSMYRLALLLGLDALREKSRTSLYSDLSKNTIFHELFSPFTSKHTEIRDMELAYLFERWDLLKGSPILKQNLGHVAKGNLPHAVDIAKIIRDHARDLDTRRVRFAETDTVSRLDEPRNTAHPRSASTPPRDNINETDRRPASAPPRPTVS